MDPSRSKTVESVQQLPILQIPGEPPASVPGEVPYLTDNEQRDAALQVQWSNCKSFGSNLLGVLDRFGAVRRVVVFEVASSQCGPNSRSSDPKSFLIKEC